MSSTNTPENGQCFTYDDVNEIRDVKPKIYNGPGDAAPGQCPEHNG